jgi:phosphoribosylformylglycinamidine synthase subunit PurQ / glutaminase
MSPKTDRNVCPTPTALAGGGVQLLCFRVESANRFAYTARMKPKALILRAAGTNCDGETAHAFELAGAESTFLHVNLLLEQPRRLRDFQILAIPGGFSYGDDIAAGRILANQIAHHLHDELHAFVDAAKPVAGVCNGFQVLIKTDLLPGPLAGLAGQTCTLTNNESGRFVDRWVRVAPRSRKCIWTSDLSPLDLPVAHGEGRFVPATEAVRQALIANDQIAFTYVDANNAPAHGSFPANPNGSADDIAGVCDATGLVLGLMPHPERHVDALQHPAWSSQNRRNPSKNGLQVFKNAVLHAVAGVGAGV